MGAIKSVRPVRLSRVVLSAGYLFRLHLIHKNPTDIRIDIQGMQYPSIYSLMETYVMCIRK